MVRRGILLGHCAEQSKGEGRGGEGRGGEGRGGEGRGGEGRGGEGRGGEGREDCPGISGRHVTLPFGGVPAPHTRRALLLRRVYPRNGLAVTPSQNAP